MALQSLDMRKMLRGCTYWSLTSKHWSLTFSVWRLINLNRTNKNMNENLNIYYIKQMWFYLNQKQNQTFKYINMSPKCYYWLMFACNEFEENSNKVFFYYNGVNGISSIPYVTNNQLLNRMYVWVRNGIVQSTKTCRENHSQVHTRALDQICKVVSICFFHIETGQRNLIRWWSESALTRRAESLWVRH